MAADPAMRWLATEECKQVVLQFMALFDARAFAQMEECVTADIEWQRPDQTVRGVAQLRDVLGASPPDVRVRHVITNLQATVEDDERITVDSYYTVYRHVGALDDPQAPAPLAGPASMGRYRDHLVRVDGGWKIARKQTFNDFRRA
jgi:3-phenylpropionate/cinnamic acid dioxygenase small subunit